jgi:hypothetical protein
MLLEQSAAACRLARLQNDLYDRQCKPPSLQFAVELRLGKKSRRCLQNLVGSLQLLVLPFKLLQAFSIAGCHAGPLTMIRLMLTMSTAT